jgi:hypothetical protein
MDAKTMNNIQVPMRMRVVKYDSAFSIYKHFKTYDITVSSRRKGVSTRIQCDGLAIHKPLTWFTYKDTHDNVLDQGIGYVWRVPVKDGGCMAIHPSYVCNDNQLEYLMELERQWHKQHGWISTPDIMPAGKVGIL